MIELPKKVIEATMSFCKLPGVGEKTASRQVMSMLNWTQEELTQFAKSIEQLKNILHCKSCGMLSDSDECQICTTAFRNESGTICVVENINDLIAIERSNNFDGIYHILGGVLNPLAGIGVVELGLDKLFSRITDLKIKNVILAINPSVEGDATCSYIRQNLKDINVERIGFGIPMGGSLEYLDSMTISKALENRKSL